MKKALLLFPLFLLALPAAAQTVGDSCDATVSEETVCVGQDVFVCVGADAAENPNTWQIIFNCVDNLSNFGSATCQDTIGFGGWCVMADNGACLVGDGQGGSIPFPCANATSGCKYGETTGAYTCTPNAPSCTPPAEGGQFTPTCSGNNAVYGCFPSGQAVYDDCTAVGGTCQNGSLCVNVTQGGTCDDEFWTCGSGLTCQGLVAGESFGTCGVAGTTPDAGPSPTTDAGTNEGPSRDDEEEEAPPSGAGGGCLGNASMNDAAPPALGLLALLGLVAIRRRR
jgi:hypothetical protein